ncbi:hypothetical protein [Nocardia sp. NBC_01327]|uniref:hypothetical protein n=1 Tax=Nocardia sp. NBC_01327 TaxID=2903593 RepID=UPI002E1314E1|nr:DUF3604 domain-containing protein [Nocardia sp. NBC_01327]
MINPRNQTGARYHDCTDAAVSRVITEEVRALPFLGELTTETTALTAGELGELVLRYTVGSSGIADSGWLKLCFKYYSDWDLQTIDPAGRDYATAELAHRSALGGASADSLATVRRLRTRYDVKGGERPFQKALLIHLEDGFVRPGDEIVIRLGDRRGGGPGTRVQTFVEEVFTFRMYADILGTSRMGHVGDVGIGIVAAAAERLVVAGPRLVRAGASAPLRAHLEDAWGNVACDSPARVEVTAGEWHSEVSLPTQGWAAATLELPAQPVGTYDVRVAAVLPDGRQLTEIRTVDVVADLPGERAYFADLHVHSDDTVGTQDSAYNFAYGRWVGGLDVLGYTANDFQITEQAWKDVVALCREVSEDGRFVCLPGVEWCGNSAVGGDHNVIYLGEDTELARSLEWHDSMTSRAPTPEHWPITELYDAYAANPDDYLLMPHLGGRRAILDWHHPELERLIEVHSAWGTGSWFLREAMSRGLRVGVSANSDEHRGRPGSGAPGANIFGGRGGLTGVLAPDLTRPAVGTALRARRTWATTGARAVALLRAGDQWMGDERARGTEEFSVSYALYGETAWEQVTVFDTEGPLLHRNLHAEQGFAPDLVRIRWGGARHRDRYRWASWTGRITVDGAEIVAADPWATMHQEQAVTLKDGRIDWASATFGNDTGVVLRLDRIEGVRIHLEATIAEEARTEQFEVPVADLSEGPVRHDMGGAGLHVTVERISGSALPSTLTGELPVRLGGGDSALYLHARQADGHEVWTSPLFFTS